MVQRIKNVNENEVAVNSMGGGGVATFDPVMKSSMVRRREIAKKVIMKVLRGKK